MKFKSVQNYWYILIKLLSNQPPETGFRISLRIAPPTTASHLTKTKFNTANMSLQNIFQGKKRRYDRYN